MTIIITILCTLKIYYIYETLKNMKIDQNKNIIKLDITCIRGCIDKEENKSYKIHEFYKSVLKKIIIVKENPNIINKIIEGG